MGDTGALIKAKLIVSPKLRAQLAKIDPARNRRIFAKAAIEAAFLIQENAAGVQILRGGGGVRRARAPHPTKLTSRTGRLRGDIAVDRGPLPQAVEIGSDLAYAATHEFGRSPIPKRPFMAPALKKIRPKIAAIVAKVWKREARL